VKDTPGEDVSAVLNRVPSTTVEHAKGAWRAEFARLVAPPRRPFRPKLVFLPAWWPSPNVAFAYFHVVAVGPGLLRAPVQVRNYVLGHELGHIERRHTLGQVGYWISVLAAVLIGQQLPPGLAFAPVMTVLVAAVAWFGLGETRRELEADDAAAARYGDQTVISGLTWMQSQRREPQSKLCARRLKRRREHLSGLVA
jgi:Zn-dependent protease with chaperone function